MKVSALLLVLVSSSLAGNIAPGSNLRPILSSQEASSFTKANYLQGWNPPSISASQVDYSVDGRQYKTIQSAVNAAIKAGGTTRKYIQVNSGNYAEAVYIPNTKVPLTIYGAGTSSVIVLKLSAQTTTAEYQNVVGPNFQVGDPAYSMYESCASKSGTIGTGCSTVVWVKAPNVQIINLTIQNTASTQGDSQAVALSIDSDKVQVDSSTLLSHQDTFYSADGGTKVQRSHITQTYIEGDVDFIFGGGTTVFEDCVFRVRNDRRNNSGVIFAPSTNPNLQYGFLVYMSILQGDSSWYSSKTVHLARAWDAGVKSVSDYVNGTSPNGQLVIRDSFIDEIIPSTAPYTTSTSGRSYSGNSDLSRDPNSNNYNRFWEFNNIGDGS